MNSKPFPKRKAISRSTSGKNAKRVLKKIQGSSKLNLVRNIAGFVLEKIPVDGIYTQDPTVAKKRFKKSIRTTAEKVLARKRSPIGLLHCVERCNVALALLRKTKIPCWSARQVYFDLATRKFGVHDFVEFYINGKVHTLEFGYSYVGGNYSKITQGTVESVLKKSPENPFIQSLVYRGIDSSQIAGASDYKKLKKFLKFPFSNEQVAKNNRRLNLLVERGVIPKTALKQIQNLK